MAINLRDHTLLHRKAYINGSWVGASNTATFEISDPATSRKIADVADLDAEQCAYAVESAARAAPILRGQTGKERSEILIKWHNEVMKARDDLAAIITAENGKAGVEALGEIDYAAGFLSWFAGSARRVDGTLIQPSNASCRVVTMKQPVGVVSIITPWNFPAAMVTRKVAAAIAAGCPCVIKPAAETPLTALALAALSVKSGLPPGAINVVTTFRNTVAIGQVLTQHPDVRKFSFTGSTAVGKMLAAQCMSTVKRVSLELGGNAPFIIFDDANIGAAVEGLMASKFRLSGQTCVCANRVYVQDSIAKDVIKAIVAKVRQFRLGPGSDPLTTHGPLISPKAVPKVKAHIADAVAKGAKVICGGEPAENLGDAYFQPTVLDHVCTGALCAREETFGPLLPITRFKSEDEVIRLANSAPVGLAGYFFTDNISRAWRVAEALEVGMVGINTGIIGDPVSPFGGIKESGLGREGAQCGIDEYLEIKSATFHISS